MQIPEITKHNEFVAYFRVSTVRQGESGLGLEAQRHAVQEFSEKQQSGTAKEFVEIESGKKTNRPELARALAYCRKHKATLLIAKLDRLARNVHFIALDMPQADRFMLHVYAAMAEEEGRRISQRTKVALSAAKARGVKLGLNGHVLAKRHRNAANEFASRIGPELERLKSSGASIRTICTQLNERKIASFGDSNWHPTSVARTLKRYNELLA